MFKLAPLIVLLATAHAFAQPSTVAPTPSDPDSEVRAVGALRGGVTATTAHTNDDGEGDPSGTDSGTGWVLDVEVGWGTQRLMWTGYLDITQVNIGSGATTPQLTAIGAGMRFHHRLIGGLYAGMGIGTESFHDDSNVTGGLAGVVDVHASYRIPGKIGLQLFLIGQAGYAPGLPLPPDEPAPSSWIMSARAEIGLAF